MESNDETHTAKVALVGDRSPQVRSHTRIPLLLETLRQRDGIALDAYWVPTEEAHATRLDRFDAIWLLPGSPYRSETGALQAARTARENGIAYLGTCGGFQHTLLEFARNVCGLTAACHAENTPHAESPLIAPLACSLIGHEGMVSITPGSAAERILGVDRTVERYHCGYGLNPQYLDVLSAHGMRFTGRDGADVRIAELPGHPFFLSTLFQPELAIDDGRCHPIVRAFAYAAVAHAAGGATVPVTTGRG